MNILVTGHRGYIGSRLVPELKKHGHEVITFLGDVCSLREWKTNIGGISPSCIIHMASMNGLLDCEINPEGSFAVNYLSALYAGQTARTLGAKLIFTLSTTSGQYETVYEQDRQNAFGALCTMRDLKLTALRLSTVYGDSPARAGRGRGVINGWVEMAKHRESIPVYREVAGKYRDYVYVGDAVQNIIKTLSLPYDGEFEVCTKVPVTVLEAATEIANLWNVGVKLTDPLEPLYPVEKRNEYIMSPRWVDEHFVWTPFREGIGRMA